MASFKIAVEVPLFLTLFSSMFTGSIYTNLIIFRTCYVTLGYNKTECALLGKIYNNNTEMLENLVEPHAAIINMVRSTTESVLAVLLCLFLGPWSDRFGRKPILVASLIGFTLSYIGTLIFSYLQNISPWYSVLCAIPITITGGTPTYFTSCISYITDVSNNDNRSIRMAVFEAVLAAGILLGNVSSSYVFYATNYMTIFAIAAIFCGSGALYAIIFIPESLQNRETEGKLRGFFQVSNIVEMARTIVKKRRRYNREIILLVLLIFIAYVYIINGDSAVTFLYFREKFHWTLTKYTLYSSVTNVVSIIGTLLGVCILHKLLNIKETILLLFGFASPALSAFLLGIGVNDYYIYTAGVVRCLCGVISPMLNTLVSKLVAEDEIGKLYAMIMALQFTIGLAAAPLYTFIYNTYLDKDPGLYNYVTAGLYIFNIVLIIGIMILQNISRSPTYDVLIIQDNQQSNYATLSDT